MKNFKAAIFDLDGTILDSMWVWKRVDEEFLGRRNIEIPSDYVKAISALNLRTAAEYTKERFDLLELVLLFRRYKCYGETFVIFTPCCSTYSVDIVFRIVRNIKINNKLDVVNVYTT